MKKRWMFQLVRKYLREKIKENLSEHKKFSDKKELNEKKRSVSKEDKEEKNMIVKKKNKFLLVRKYLGEERFVQIQMKFFSFPISFSILILLELNNEIL